MVRLFRCQKLLPRSFVGSMERDKCLQKVYYLFQEFSSFLGKPESYSGQTACMVHFPETAMVPQPRFCLLFLELPLLRSTLMSFHFSSRFAGPKWVKPWAAGLVPRGDLVVARDATRGLLGPIPPWVTLWSYDFSACICEKYCSVEQLNFNALLTRQNSSQRPQEHTDLWIPKSWSELQIIHVRTKLGLPWQYVSGCCV